MSHGSTASARIPPRACPRQSIASRKTAVATVSPALMRPPAPGSQVVKTTPMLAQDARLKRRRPGHVPEGEHVIVAAHPEHAVEGFGQLGRDRNDDQREHQRSDVQRRRGLVQRGDEELRAENENAHGDHQLQGHQHGVRLATPPADDVQWFGHLAPRSAAAQRGDHVPGIRGKQRDTDGDARRRSGTRSKRPRR